MDRRRDTGMRFGYGAYRDSDAFKRSMKKTSSVFHDGQEVLVRGVFVSNRYQGDNGFVIATLDMTQAVDKSTGREIVIPTREEELICKGTIIGYQDGQTFGIEGRIVDDRTYGIQLSVRKASPVQPSSKDAMAAFLANSGINGLGPATAKKIVDALGDNAYEIVTQHPERLAEMDIKGVRKSVIDSIIDEVPSHLMTLEAVAFLSELGLSQARCATIIKLYGNDTIKVMKANPYVLTKAKGFAFTSADAIARTKFGIAMDDPRRIDAGIVATLRWACATYGHTMVPTADVYDIAYGKLGIPDKEHAMRLLNEAKERVIKEGTIVETGNCLQLRYLYRAEAKTIKAIGDLLEHHKPIAPDSEVTSTIRKCMPSIGYELTDEQLSVTHAAFANGITLLTASAGAGKSTAIKMVVQVADRLGIPYILCSPTGKAAKRLSEACTVTGHKPPQAFTLHRALGIGMDDDDTEDMYADVKAKSAQATETFLAAKLVLCDEASMLDATLAATLTSKCVGKHLLLIGDPNQLPSVGPGAVLADMLACPDIPCVRLSKVFRQADGSPIIMAANAVLEGRDPCVIPGVEFHECADEDVLKTIDEFVVPRIRQDGLGYQDIAFMSPMKKRTTTSGVDALNAHLRPIMNRRFKDDGKGNLKLQAGDFVTQTKNNYQVDCFNGDQGVISRIEGKDVHITFFDSTEDDVTYSIGEAKQNVMLAYASTIHRYQGSQCDTVVLVMTDAHFIMCTRNLLYTGITRAAKRIILIGNETAFKRAAKNAKAMKRTTGLQGMRFATQESLGF